MTEGDPPAGPHPGSDDGAGAVSGGEGETETECESEPETKRDNKAKTETESESETETATVTETETATDPTARPDGSWHPVADREAFDSTSRVLVDIDGLEVAVFRIDGEYHALANHCVHQGGPLCSWAVSTVLTADEELRLALDPDRRAVSCPWHGWEFDIETGEHLAPSGHRVPTYDVTVEGDRVYVRR